MVVGMAVGIVVGVSSGRTVGAIVGVEAGVHEARNTRRRIAATFDFRFTIGYLLIVLVCFKGTENS